MAGGSKFGNSETTAVGPGQQTSKGYSPQTAGMANLNDAFGGNSAAQNQTLAIQQYYRDHPEMSPDQVSKVVNAEITKANAYYNPDSTASKIFGGLALAGSLAGISLFGGAVLAPAIAAGAGVSGAAAGGAGVAGSVGTGIGAIGASAVGGAASGALGAALQGQNIGKGALLGGIGGGLGAAAGPAVGGLTANGIPQPIANGLVKGGIGAATNAASGGNAAVGFLGGAASGVASGLNSNLGGNAFTGVAAGLGAKALTGAISGPSTGAISGPSTGAVSSPSTGVGGQGNIGNMAATSANSGLGMSTDSTLAGTIGSALPGILQGAAGVYGSQNAAEKQTQADQNAINTQQSTLGNINGIWNTQQGLGQGAQTALGTALGTNGQPADYSGFKNMPGYQFAVQQGTQAIQRQAAAMGNAYTPNTAAAVGQYVTGTAAQDYNTYISQLMGAAGLGSTASTALTGANMGVGANISQLQQNQGQAQASGVTGAANSVGGLFGVNGAGTSLIGAAGKALTGGGSAPGSGGATASGVGGINPFAGTSLANNSGAYQAYNAANGPTAGDIANSTNGIGNIDTSSFDPNNFGSQFNGNSAFDDSMMNNDLFGNFDNAFDTGDSEEWF